MKRDNNQPPSASGERELPPLPTPDLLMPWRVNAPDGSVHSGGFTAEQMRDYARAALAPSPGIDAAEQLAELLRGLEAGPAFQTAAPGQLFLLGQAVATQAKRAAPPAAQPSAEWLAEAERMLDVCNTAMGEWASGTGAPNIAISAKAALLDHLKARA